MKVLLDLTICMEKASISGMMEENSEVRTLITSWRDTAYSLGKTAVSTSAATKMIKKVDTALSNGQMDENILVPGQTVNKMVKELTLTKTVKRELVLGKMAKESIG